MKIYMPDHELSDFVVSWLWNSVAGSYLLSLSSVVLEVSFFCNIPYTRFSVVLIVVASSVLLDL